MWGIIFLAVMLIAGVTVSHMSDKPDSPLEQTIETVIKAQTGQDVDFSADKKNKSK